MELYESMDEILDTVRTLRKSKDHPVLEQLERKLKSSIAEQGVNYQALKHGQTFFTQLTNILYGEKDEKGIRNTQEYKIQSNSQGVEQLVEQLIEQSYEQYTLHSPQMRDYLLHFQNTYQNWKSRLFTCYDYPNIPNDNNRLELSHSQMKRQYRRITGQMSTAKYLKIHGEQIAFLLPYQGQVSEAEIVNILRKTDYQDLKEQKNQLKEKSRQRGKTTATKSKLDKTLQEIKNNWCKKGDQGP